MMTVSSCLPPYCVLWAILTSVPSRTSGGCRTRWSCTTLARALHTKYGLEESAWTVRRWPHVWDWVWKRAKLVAKDNDQQTSSASPGLKKRSLRTRLRLLGEQSVSY